MKNDVPINQRTIRLRWRSPRKVALLNPFQLPLALCLALVAITFTLWPEALEHSPISFERRGIVHHAWHYSLLAGSLILLFGMFYAGRRRLAFELGGLIIVWGVLALNFTALLSGTTVLIDPPGQQDILRGTGLGMGLRLAILSGLAIRIWIVVTEPTVDLPAATNHRATDGDG